MAIYAAVRRAKINFGLWAESLDSGDVIHEQSGLSVEDVHLLATLLDISLRVANPLPAPFMEPLLHSVADTGSQYISPTADGLGEENEESEDQVRSQSS